MKKVFRQLYLNFIGTHIQNTVPTKYLTTTVCLMEVVNCLRFHINDKRPHKSIGFCYTKVRVGGIRIYGTAPCVVNDDFFFRICVWQRLIFGLFMQRIQILQFNSTIAHRSPIFNIIVASPLFAFIIHIKNIFFPASKCIQPWGLSCIYTFINTYVLCVSLAYKFNRTLST